MCVSACMCVWVSVGVRITRCKFTKFSSSRCYDLLLPNKNNKYKQKLNGRREVWRYLNNGIVIPSALILLLLFRFLGLWPLVIGWVSAWLGYYTNYGVNFTGNIISFYESTKWVFFYGSGYDSTNNFAATFSTQKQ